MKPQVRRSLPKFLPLNKDFSLFTCAADQGLYCITNFLNETSQGTFSKLGKWHFFSESPQISGNFNFLNVSLK